MTNQGYLEELRATAARTATDCVEDLAAAMGLLVAGDTNAAGKMEDALLNLRAATRRVQEWADLKDQA